jgi:hypothetical protein
MATDAIVTGIISNSTSTATTLIASATAALQSLAAFDANYGTLPNVEVGAVDPVSLMKPNIPVKPEIDKHPDKDSSIDFGKIVIPDQPDINYPDPPSLINISIPSKPIISSPSMQNTYMGTLYSITLPDIPVIDIREFSVTPPVPIPIDVPTWTFDIDNILISDDPLIVAMKNKLLSNVVDGGTGLSPVVETDIWNRDLERNEQSLADATDKTVSMWAKKGFSLPAGLLADSLISLQTEYMNKSIDRSREIAIKQAELEQTNLFKSIELGTTLSTKLIDQLIQYQQLILTAQEYSAKYFNEYINLQIACNNSNMELFKARVQAYEISIRANIAMVDLYKARIEGELMKVTMNETTAKVYSSQIEAEVSKYRGSLEGQKVIGEIFSTEMQGVVAQANVNESIIKAYAEQVRTLSTVSEIYKSRVEAALAEAGIEKMKLDANIAETDTWAKQSEISLKEYQARLDAYKEELRYEMASAEIGNKMAETVVQLELSAAELRVNAAKVAGDALVAQGNARLEAARGVAAAAASMAAGAMAGVSANANLGYSESLSMSGTV